MNLHVSLNLLYRQYDKTYHSLTRGPLRYLKRAGLIASETPNAKPNRQHGGRFKHESDIDGGKKMNQSPEPLMPDDEGFDEEMVVSPLVLMGNPILRAVAPPIEAGESDIPALADEMIAIMHQAQGVGLAAPQIGLAKRLIVFEIPASRLSSEEEEAPLGPQFLINPQIEPVGAELVDGLEGCLSIPGLRGIVPRHVAVWYRGIGRDGVAVEGMAEGFHARVLQHEVDHLDGILFLDRMKTMRQLAFEQEAHHLGEMIG